MKQRKVHLISYSTPSYFKSQKRLEKSALKYGIDNVINLNIIWLRLFNYSFIRSNKLHFSYKKGGGYWLWKPYIILKSLYRLKENDILIYLDSGIEIINPVTPLVDLCLGQNIILFSLESHLNKDWTKKDAFYIMDCDTNNYFMSYQLVGGIMVLKKNKTIINFIKRWLKYCQNFQLISDADNIYCENNFPNFITHRHDQSILSLLALKDSIFPFRCASQFGNNLKLVKFRKKGEYLDTSKNIPAHIRGKYFSESAISKKSNYGTIFNIHRTQYTGIFERFNILVFLNMIFDAFCSQFWLLSIHKNRK